VTEDAPEVGTLTGERAGADGMPRRLLPLLAVLVFVVNADVRVMTAMLPEIAGDLGVSVSAVGLALTGYLFAYGLLQLAYGPLGDRVGTVRVMAGASIVFVVVLAAGALARDLGTLVGVRLLTGAVAAAFFPLALATVANLVPYEQRQAAIGTLLGALAVGQITGAAAGGIVSDLLSLRVMFAVHATLAAALVVPLFQARAAVPAGATGGAPFAAYGRLVRNRRALLLATVVFVEGAAFFGGTGYLGALLHEEYGLRLGWVGAILMLEGVALFVASRWIGPLRGRLGEGRMIVVGGGLMGSGFLLALAFGRWEAALPAVVALGVGFALCHTTLQTRATELDSAARGTAISVFAFALLLGSATGTAALGTLLAIQGYDALLAVAGLALLAVGGFAPRLTALSPETAEQPPVAAAGAP
jgi:MFS transporter, YNFM family, putative membrane transport protein